MFKRLFARLRPAVRSARPAQPARPAQAAPLPPPQVSDAPGWQALTGRPHEYSPAQVSEIYGDALTAWRKNPIAWRIIAITTDYCVGDGLQIDSPVKSLSGFIDRFWRHPQNHMDLRLEAMSDELARAGDLFVLLFRNPADGMSYLRLVTKDRITRIETAPNDWERELAYLEAQEGDPAGRRWLSPYHPEAAAQEAVMLHYSVNRPAGALLGEGDLTTMLPWLQRYSRMLEDRVRLHWAVRSFLWLVTVPANAVNAKREQYRQPPDGGSIVVKDEGEKWEPVAPDLKGQDARWDLQAVRGMIDAGSGYPPHWRGEAGDANLATATAMQGPTERHLLRRQRYFLYLLQDILYWAYQRAWEAGMARRLPSADYARLFSLVVPEISRWDNESLARAAAALAQALGQTRSMLPGQSQTFTRLALRMIAKFAGEPQPEAVIEQILAESQTN